MWVSDREERIKLLFGWQEYFFDGFDVIEESTIVEFLVEELPLGGLVGEGGFAVIAGGVEWLLNAAEHVFGVA